MSFFAANSLLCRLALKDAGMDAASFTVVRMVSAAVPLGLLMLARKKNPLRAGSFKAALALFMYMLFFSFAYLQLPAATGTLVLMVLVQAVTLCYGSISGNKAHWRQLAGIAVAVCGVVVLLWPGLAPPPAASCLMMCAAGAAWAVYSILGRKASDPALHTAGNFIRCLPLAIPLLPFCAAPPANGLFYAILSGALASGFGYILWYWLVARLSVATTAVVQLSAPFLTMLGAAMLLAEPITAHLLISAVIVLLGIAVAELRAQQPGSRQLPENRP